MDQRDEFEKQLRRETEKGQGKWFAHLSEALIVISRKDQARLSVAIENLVSESKGLSKGRRIYANSIEAELSTKGLALSNLAKSFGLSVPVVDLIPAELVL
jgi:hypothetical protein